MNQPLVDRYQRTHTYLRVSVTDRCNFRCRYCMPPEGLDWQPRSQILTYEEIERLSKLFVGMGVNKIRLTGGEPTVRKGLVDLMQRLSGLRGLESLLMTTNGNRLASMARTYREAGLTGVNISLDSLNKDRFEHITMRKGFNDVVAGIDAAVEAGLNPVKINVVVMKGVNADEILDFVEFVKDRPINVRFIEFMPFEGNGWSEADVYSYAQMRKDIATRYELIPQAVESGAVGKDFLIEGFAGTVGFVTSMTEHFCATCNRVRLTADGQLKACLFSAAEANLRDRMRDGATDEDLAKTIRIAMLRKPKEHPPMDQLLRIENRSMVQIGG